KFLLHELYKKKKKKIEYALYRLKTTFYERVKKLELESQFFNIDMPKLNPNQARKLESPITEGEIRKAVSLMNTGKSPDNDRFPVYQETFEKGQLPPTFNQTLISLIPKKDRDTTCPSNFRPISLLNVDCNILTKVLALRLQQVLPNIRHVNQVGFMKNRSSSDTAFSLDAEKGFLFPVLSYFGFGSYFSQWVKILYKEPKAAVITNGIILTFFGLSRRTNQGCSLRKIMNSMFIIFLETLAVSGRIVASKELRLARIYQQSKMQMTFYFVISLKLCHCPPRATLIWWKTFNSNGYLKA
uniref:Reverse transcriptase domain-containing protein n=1 Tax=Seriola dumerili TaxID=41447 RepID=A0A3B4V3N4_SERDU